MSPNANQKWTLEDILDLKADNELFEKMGLSREKELIEADIQANILKDTKHRYTLYCFLTFTEREKKPVADWLKNMPITSAKDQKGADPAVNLFLSFEGYRFFFDPAKIKAAILLDDDDIIAFSEGLAKRCHKAFGGENRRFVEDRYEQPAHALVLISTDDPQIGRVADTEDRYLKAFFKKHTTGSVHSFREKFGEVFFEIGRRNPEDDEKQPAREWFGFRDGISNPRFFPSGVLADSLGFKPDKPSPLNVALRVNNLSPSKFACGSFVVFMKLEQNPEAFNGMVENLANRLGMQYDKEKAAALLMGRYRDGRPLAGGEHPTDFNYDNDPKGAVCPFHAHIRKANPRDGDNGNQIVRRGKIYGGDKKGILFLSFQGRLRSFEDIVNRGLYGFNNGRRPTGIDPLFMEKGKYQQGHVYRDAAGRVSKHTYIRPDDKPVTFRGGQYFFASSISFIRKNLENFM